MGCFGLGGGGNNRIRIWQMITTAVTKEKLDAWEKLYSKNKGKLRASRISGR